MNPVFTVLTPTYNRSTLLSRLHDSLKAQQMRSFEWVVVDDGSTDSTPMLLQELKAQGRVAMTTLRQESGHKKSALNRGLEVARGQLLVQVDDDDVLPPDALECLWSEWSRATTQSSETLIGVTGLCARPDGQVVGDRFPVDGLLSYPLEVSRRFHVSGDKAGCQDVSVLRRFPFPEGVPGMVPEGVVWNAIAEAGFKTVYVNRVVRICDDSPSGITRTRTWQSILEHSPGGLLHSLSLVRLWEPRHGISFLLRDAANVSRFALLAAVSYGSQVVMSTLRIGYVRFGRPTVAERLLLLGTSPLGLALAAADRWRLRGTVGGRQQTNR